MRYMLYSRKKTLIVLITLIYIFLSFLKIMIFIEQHYEQGELHMEFLKGSCISPPGLCHFCTDDKWVFPPMNRIPRPYPDYNQLPRYHYKDVFDSPVMNEDGTPRSPYGFNPHAAIKVAHQSDVLTNEDEIQEFL